MAAAALGEPRPLEYQTPSQNSVAWTRPHRKEKGVSLWQHGQRERTERQCLAPSRIGGEWQLPVRGGEDALRLDWRSCLLR